MMVWCDLVYVLLVLVLKVVSCVLVGGVGGMDVVGVVLGVWYQWMLDCGLLNMFDFLCIDEVVIFEELMVGQLGWLWVMCVLVVWQGFVLFVVLQMGVLFVEWYEVLGSMVKEVGDVMQCVCVVLFDGYVCIDDGCDIDCEIGEVIEKLVQLCVLLWIVVGIEVEVDDLLWVDVWQLVVFCEMLRL